MKNRKIAYVLMTMSFVMIVAGGMSSFVINLKADKDATYKRMDDVSDAFENFSANTSVFEEYRDNLYNSTLGNLTYDTMYRQDKDIKNSLSNYENLVDELKKNTGYLDRLCEDVYYPNSEVNNKCYNYKSIYEQVVNYFVSDINVYNNSVDKYNSYQAGLNINSKLAKYTTKKTYIDYNKDKKFDGKEEK